MEYQVPQFIEVEDKIVGPLTLKQFVYLAGGGGLCLVFFFELPLVFAIVLSLPIAGLAVALAFYKVNGKPFIDMLEAGFSYYTAPKLFLWKHGEEEKQAEWKAAPKVEEALSHAKPVPRLTRGKLSELAWSLDIKKPTELGRRP